jgi:hypothetical protein
VTRMIEGLEAHFGLRLFHRTLTDDAGICSTTPADCWMWRKAWKARWATVPRHDQGACREACVPPPLHSLEPVPQAVACRAPDD